MRRIGTSFPHHPTFDEFGGTVTALLTPEMIEVEFADTAANVDFSEHRTSALFLFPAENRAQPGEPLDVVPVERMVGVPKYYLLHLINVSAGGGYGGVDPTGPYTLRVATVGDVPGVDPTFLLDAGDTIHVPAGLVDDPPAPGDNAGFRVDSTFVGDLGVAIPLGDINGDGLDDFVCAVRDELGDMQEALPSEDPGFHPAERLDPSSARICFGSSQPQDRLLDSDTVTLALPAPVEATSVWGSRSFIEAAGDFNGGRHRRPGRGSDPHGGLDERHRRLCISGRICLVRTQTLAWNG